VSITNESAINNEQKNYPCWTLDNYYSGRTGGESVLHQQACEDCFTWLFENDISRFNHVLNKALSAKVRRGTAITKFAYRKSCDTPNNYFSSNHELFELTISCLQPYELPQKFSLLPEIAGIYILVASVYPEEILYVGSSQNIRQRLSGHELRNFIEKSAKSGLDFHLYCLPFPLPSSDETMRTTEKFLIQELKPKHNTNW
jgi:hypothetical protein